MQASKFTTTTTSAHHNINDSRPPAASHPVPQARNPILPDMNHGHLLLSACISSSDAVEAHRPATRCPLHPMAHEGWPVRGFQLDTGHYWLGFHLLQSICFAFLPACPRQGLFPQLSALFRSLFSTVMLGLQSTPSPLSAAVLHIP